MGAGCRGEEVVRMIRGLTSRRENMNEKIIVEWWGHPRIEEIDDFVESNFDKQCKDDYFGEFNAVHMADWKAEITRWIQDRKDRWDELQALVDDLPDDEYEEYELDGDTVRGLESTARKEP